MNRDRRALQIRKRPYAILLLLSLLPCLLSACSPFAMGRSEPEQIYSVSAVGFDAVGEQIRVSLELPSVGDGKSGGATAEVVAADGESVTEALSRIEAGLGRELQFGHCGLMVLGEGMSRAQTEAVFSFAATGDSLPLATEVMATPVAEELLRAGVPSFLATGYGLPSVWHLERESLGLDIRSEIYALCADSTPNRRIVIPYFLLDGEKRALFSGLQILRSGADAIRLSREECVGYALLCDRFSGTRDSVEAGNGSTLSKSASSLAAVWDGEQLSFSLTLSLRLSSSRADGGEHLGEELRGQAEAVFLRLQAEAGEDLVGFDERLKKQDAPLWDRIKEDYDRQFRNATLRVTCEIREVFR